MAEGCIPYPSVFVVDSQAGYPLLPPKPRPLRQRGGAAQTLLFLLVAVALCGMAMEACFIYHLYTTRPASDSGITAQSSQDKDEIEVITTQRPNPVVKPSKPLAHLTGGAEPPRSDGVMMWVEKADPIIYGMEHKDGKLIIQKEGYYSVYSKICFSDNGRSFTHSVLRVTPRSPNDLVLLQSRRYHPKIAKQEAMSNSYLGGVFHFHKDEAIFVKVVNHTMVRNSIGAENFFGAYMI